MYRSLKLLFIVLFLTSCSVPKVQHQPQEADYTTQRGLQIESCMFRLLQKGVHQQLILPICGEIYSQPPLMMEKNYKLRSL